MTNGSGQRPEVSHSSDVRSRDRRTTPNRHFRTVDNVSHQPRRPTTRKVTAMFFHPASTYEFTISTHHSRIATATRRNVAGGGVDRTRSHRAIFRPSAARVHHH